jgi:hypothetical protein
VSRLQHYRYRRYVDAHVDRELVGGIGTRVAAHIAQCPMCAAAAELTVHVKASLARRRPAAERVATRLRA